ncbi:MAG: hypothetical protein GDA46_03530 [Bdellovibrionales bacterium]|nr:hypothetical protein [Bdellovibrionales bacterium]
MKKLILISNLFLLSSCILGGDGFSHQDSLILAPSKEGSRPRDRRRFSSDIRGICRDNADCEDICEDIYDDDLSLSQRDEAEGRVEKCSDLSYREVYDFQDIEDAFYDPAYSSFKNLESKNFKNFLDVSLEPWITFTEDVTISEAKTTLRWIASEKGIADAIESAYENDEDFDLYEGVFNLLLEITRDNYSILKERCDDLKCGGLSGEEKRNCVSEKRTYYCGDEDSMMCYSACRAVNQDPIAGNQAFSEIAENNSSAESFIEEFIDFSCEDSCLPPSNN